jgi:hypothetical protein
MVTTTLPQYNPLKLHKDLAAAGLPVVSVSSAGRLDFSRQLTPQEQTLANQIAAAHTPADPSAERLAAYNLAGITPEELIVALWEKIIENRPEAADSLQSERLAVKDAIPKE